MNYKCVCGHEWEVDDAVSECPKCDSKKVTVEEKTIDVTVVDPTKSSNPYDVVMKTLSDISCDIKGNQKAFDERFTRYEADLHKVQEAQSEIATPRKSADMSADYTTRSLMSASGMLSNEKFMSLTTEDPVVQEIQCMNDDIYILGSILEAKGLGTVRTSKYYKEFIEKPIIKAMHNSAGVGSEWVPTGFSGMMIDIINLQLKVAGLFQTEFMPTSPYTSPLKTGHSRAYNSTNTGQSSDAPQKFKASNVTTSAITYAAELITARVVVDNAWDEDSIIAAMPMIRADISVAIAESIESAILNGDTSQTLDVTDMYGDTLNSQSPEVSWDGIRRTAQIIDAGGETAVTDLAGVFLTSGLSFRTARSNMNKYAVNSTNLAIIAGTRGYLKGFLTQNDVIPLNKYGVSAVVLTGELANFDGIPLIVSEFQRQDLNASGTEAGTSGGVDTSFQIVHRKGFRIGDRRRFIIDTEKIKGTDSVEIWASIRMDFQRVFATSEPVVHNVVDID